MCVCVCVLYIYIYIYIYIVIFSYEACYDYTINQDDECELMNQRVVDLYNFAYGDDTIYEVETPIISPSNVYPNDKICFFEIGKR